MSETGILVVEDDRALGEALCDTLTSAGYRVIMAEDGRKALARLESEWFDLIISDVQMPNMTGTELLQRIKKAGGKTPVILMTAYASVEQAVEAMRYGAVDYLVKPFEAEVLVNMIERYVGYAEQTPSNIVACDKSSRNLLTLAKKIANNDVTVMITGESGVGKEVIARYIHDNSPRKDKAFVAINCAAIPENMLEATLFGYEKGAYTGAYKASPGKFELANGGTLLLDEISEMDIGLQAKLLRVLQEKEVERLGGSTIIDLDVRVIATSNRNMREYVAKKKFREDLFYRLNVFPLEIKPLRERTDDVVPLTEQFLKKHARQQGQAIPMLTEEAKDKLVAHAWPGNVRELENVCQRAMILHQDEIVTASDIHFEQALFSVEDVLQDVIKTEPVAGQSYNSDEMNMPEQAAQGLSGDVKNHEWKVILSALQDFGGCRKDAAKKLGISQRTLRYKLAKMRDSGIQIPGASGVEHA